ncbi:hypothetical protein ACHAW6_006798 [Cyclotella cf. meneghiniana]
MSTSLPSKHQASTGGPTTEVCGWCQFPTNSQLVQALMSQSPSTACMNCQVQERLLDFSMRHWDTQQKQLYSPLQNTATLNAKALTNAYEKIFQWWKATGAVSPNWHILDNEAHEELKQAIRANKCRVELTPADLHRRNAAERTIQTFNRHFISVLARVADSFPINQWDELLPQMILTLNLLRQLNVAPNISAWSYHHGSFDYY